MSVRPADAFRFLSVALILIVGGIHLQQYEGILNSVPTINALFVLNAIGAAVLALVMAADRDFLGIAAGFGAIGLCIGSLISLAISRTGTLFDYSEPTLRGAVEFATYVEVAAVVAIAGFIVLRLREPRSAGVTGDPSAA